MYISSKTHLSYKSLDLLSFVIVWILIRNVNDVMSKVT
jgi:hypothetical protein